MIGIYGGRNRGGAGRASTTIPIYALPPATGTQYYVDAVSGNDANNGLAPGSGHAWATLQKAVNTVTAGSIVSVYSGNYTSAGVIFNCANVHGTSTNWIIFKNAPGQSPKIVAQTTEQFPFQIGNCSFMAFQGLEFVGTNASLTLSGALANPSQTQYLTQATTIGSSTPGGTHHIQFLNCYIHDFPAAGFGSYNSDYLTVMGCRIDNNALYDFVSDSGIDITSPGNSDTVAGYHMVIVGNTCTGNRCLVPTSPGGSATDGEALIIDSGGINSYTGKILIANNIMNASGSIGIEVFDSANADVIYNTCYGNNLILTNGGGICVPTSTNCNIFNNIVQTTVSASTLGISSDGAGSVYGYNLGFGGNGATIPGSNNLTSNPQFVNPSAGNFALQAGSPAIGTANAAWTIATDIFGNPRPGPSGYSRGAVETASGGGGGSSVALVSHVGIVGTGASSGTFTSSAISTLGATLLVFSTVGFSGNSAGQSVSDSMGNVWTALTKQTDGSDQYTTVYYCFPIAAKTSASHTFSIVITTTNNSVGQVAAFSGIAGTLVSQNGAALSSSPASPGLVTPSVNGSLIITGLGCQVSAGSNTFAIGNGTITDSSAFNPGTTYGGALAYYVQPTAGGISMSWTVGGTITSITTTVAVFV